MAESDKPREYIQRSTRPTLQTVKFVEGSFYSAVSLSVPPPHIQSPRNYNRRCRRRRTAAAPSVCEGKASGLVTSSGFLTSRRPPLAESRRARAPMSSLQSALVVTPRPLEHVRLCHRPAHLGRTTAPAAANVGGHDSLEAAPLASTASLPRCVAGGLPMPGGASRSQIRRHR
ncbi:hypothetical protein HK405_001351 [Cladochytrium tenue]|nr:hypothetical protein HK405_001351 [Cladochytrium tenue]